MPFRFLAALMISLPALAETATEAPVRPIAEAEAFDERSATVLVFVFPDCPVANRYAPALNSLHEAYAERGIAFFRVYAGEHTAEEVAAHADAYAYRFPAVLDPDLDLVRRTGARVTPEAVVYDREGTRRYRGSIDNRYVALGRYRPEATEHYLRDALDTILEGGVVQIPETEAIGCFLPEPPQQASEESEETPEAP